MIFANISDIRIFLNPNIRSGSKNPNRSDPNCMYVLTAMHWLTSKCILNLLQTFKRLLLVKLCMFYSYTNQVYWN